MWERKTRMSVFGAVCAESCKKALHYIAFCADKLDGTAPESLHGHEIVYKRGDEL
jgi:hypothetical protein